MLFKNLYENNSFIIKVYEAMPMTANWIKNFIDEQGRGITPAIDALDNYLFLSCGNKEIFEAVGSTKPEIYKRISLILESYKYKLDTLYESTQFEYDPISNYDKTETQTHNEEVNTADHVAETIVGSRKQTDTTGARTDSLTTGNKNTAFDSTDYAKATTQNNTSNVYGSQTDTTETDAATDKTTQKGYKDTSSGGYTLKTKGNIGVMSTQDMIKQEREVAMYSFYDAVRQVLYDEILLSVWEV